ncbi:hypothetical protein EVAR_68550_1 [Eumeta japonica]|uniref:Uncharacterized protein n=1 Tax=Eumeta variegata TaxID=151549 RepID=A0A4C2A3Q4_EUMVA|nr:hypothetical protein EVAR_68550_1 [Eumeta japonica]
MGRQLHSITTGRKKFSTNNQQLHVTALDGLPVHGVKTWIVIKVTCHRLLQPKVVRAKKESAESKRVTWATITHPVAPCQTVAVERRALSTPDLFTPLD